MSDDQRPPVEFAILKEALRVALNDERTMRDTLQAVRERNSLLFEEKRVLAYRLEAAVPLLEMLAADPCSCSRGGPVVSVEVRCLSCAAKEALGRPSAPSSGA